METCGNIQVKDACGDGEHFWPLLVGDPVSPSAFDGHLCFCRAMVVKLKFCEYGGEHLVQESSGV